MKIYCIKKIIVSKLILPQLFSPLNLHVGDNLCTGAYTYMYYNLGYERGVEIWNSLN